MIRIDNGIVFSYDINRILKGKNALNFNYEQRGMPIPKEEDIRRVRRSFEKDVNKIFDGNVKIVSEQKMENYLYEVLADAKGIPVVSLDRIYLHESTEIDQKVYFLDCTRISGSKVLIPRREVMAIPVTEQIRRISNELKENGTQNILLFDDVVFSGGVLRNIISQFQQNDIVVDGIRACISTEKSYNNFNKTLNKGLKCGCILGDDVIDQVCERDFYFGVVQSGISIRAQDGKTYKAPYFKPFGNPVERASIPQKNEISFSNGCLLRSMYLWGKIEEISGKKVYMGDLPERIIGTNQNDRIIDILRRGLIYGEKDTDRSNGFSSRLELWR